MTIQYEMSVKYLEENPYLKNVTFSVKQLPDIMSE